MVGKIASFTKCGGGGDGGLGDENSSPPAGVCVCVRKIMAGQLFMTDVHHVTAVNVVFIMKL